MASDLSTAEGQDAPHAPITLSVDVHFVAPEEQIWPELTAGDPLPLPDAVLAQHTGSFVDNWVLRLYHALSVCGLAVTLGSAPRPDRINIVSARDFGRRLARADAYILTARADAHHPCLADFIVYQNLQFPETATSANILHWPQPGLVPRDPARGTQLDSLVFKGHAENLAEPFRSEGFLVALSDLGVRLEFDERDITTDAHNWSNYRTADAVLAIRDMTDYVARLKPGSKLVNAWAAGVPAILGPEPAFDELRKSDLDYIEARTPEAVLNAVACLKSDPELYRAMVENGRVRAAEITDETVLRSWCAALNGKVRADFDRWQKTPLVLRRARMLARLIAEPYSKRLHMYRVEHGSRN